MTNNDTISDAEHIETKPPGKTRPKTGNGKVSISKRINGEFTSLATIPERIIGIPVKQRIVPYVRDTFGYGDYEYQLQNSVGRFLPERDGFSIPEPKPDRERIIDIEPETETDESDFDAPEYDMSSEVELRAELIAVRREMKELRERERERQDTAKDSQSEMLAMMRESAKQSEKSFQQGLQMAQMIMSQQQPKENPSELMLSMLRGTLEVQRGVDSFPRK